MKKNMIWLDLEMTGLNPNKDCILELATIITDSNLNTLAEGPVIAIYQPDIILNKMNEWNFNQHSKSGLIKRVKESKCDIAYAEENTLIFLQKWIPSNSSPLCGNSICNDRRFLYQYMPKLESYFYYRNVDVSTIKELAMRWAPKLVQNVKKKCNHLALDDIRESIDELRYYRKFFFK